MKPRALADRRCPEPRIAPSPETGKRTKLGMQNSPVPLYRRGCLEELRARMRQVRQAPLKFHAPLGPAPPPEITLTQNFGLELSPGCMKTSQFFSGKGEDLVLYNVRHIRRCRSRRKGPVDHRISVHVRLVGRTFELGRVPGLSKKHKPPQSVWTCRPECSCLTPRTTFHTSSSLVLFLRSEDTSVAHSADRPSRQPQRCSVVTRPHPRPVS